MYTALNKHQEYRITAECNNTASLLTLAGFCADEQTENMLLRHLSNLCVQSDGSLINTHSLLCKLVSQWQAAFDIPAIQLLTSISGNDTAEKLKSVCLYKTKTGETEKLINRILLF